MAWKGLALALLEFLVGVSALRYGLPLGSIFLAGLGLALTLVGLSGLVRPLTKPREVPRGTDAT